MLDLGGLAAGAVFFPRTTLRAFVRGRRSGNLYGDARWERLLDDDLEVVRARLPVPSDARVTDATPAERAAFAAWACAGWALWLGPLAALAIAAAPAVARAFA